VENVYPHSSIEEENAMPVASPELHLIVDCGLPGTLSSSGPVKPEADSSTDRPRALKTLRVSGVSYLHPGGPVENLVGEAPADDSLVIEPLADGSQPRLLLVTPRSAPVPRVNGRLAPRVCLLRLGDQLLLDDGRLLHLSAFQRSPIVSASEEQAGSLCPICRTTIEPGTRVFCCPSCGLLLHCEKRAEPDDENRLECAKLRSDCPSCRNPVNLSGGFQYVPDAE
jgi:hypothetical protein